MLKELDYYDWEEVFKYASPEKADAERSNVDLSPFDRERVSRILGLSWGFNDGDDWICLGQLSDGRYFFIAAGCGYTGWGCQESGRSYVANTLNALSLNITAEERARIANSVKEVRYRD